KEIKELNKRGLEFMANLKHPGGWRELLYVFFGDYSWCRRILGGRWELWGHDVGRHNTVLTWHWVKDWSDKIFKEPDFVIMKASYRNGKRLSDIQVLLGKEK